MFDLSGLNFLTRETIPVVIDHNPELVVGEVSEFVSWDWTDQRWLVARARLDRAPSWVRRGTKASFSYRVLRSYEVNNWTVVSHSLVDEVSAR